MSDRFTLLGYLFGAVAFCTFGVFSLHHAAAVGTTLAAVLTVVTAAAVAPTTQR